MVRISPEHGIANVSPSICYVYERVLSYFSIRKTDLGIIQTQPFIGHSLEQNDRDLSVYTVNFKELK